MTEDAQAAFLKTLEEPPSGTVLVLTATDEERLLPTIRSRCIRLRLGPVARRDVEGILLDGELADAPLAARLARLSGGRPADAVALARSPESLVIRSEIGRTLIDLSGATRTDRLRTGRDLLARAADLLASSRGAPSSAESSRSSRGRRAPARPAVEAPVDGDAPTGVTTGRVAPAERRAAALALIAIWRDVARDLALVSLGEAGDVRQLDLLDDLEAAAHRLPGEFAAAQLRRLDVGGERLEGNVSPELVIDALALGWTA
jgi:hypothetical protein